MWAYFDTSALIKRYIKETGRREVLQFLRRYDVVTSVIVPVELRSALRRRASEGTLDAERVPEVLKRVATDRAYWTLVEIANDLHGDALRCVRSQWPREKELGMFEIISRCRNPVERQRRFCRRIARRDDFPRHE